MAERRARLARRHHLVPGAKAPDPVTAAAGLVGVHATDPATVYLSFAARLADPDPARVERALYEERTLLKVIGMRRTMFVCTREVAALVLSGVSPAIAGRGRALTGRLLAASGVADPAAWLAEVEAETLRALEARGEATAAELTRAVPRLATRVRLAPGKPYEAVANVTTRVLFELAGEGRIVRGRPLGGWLSSQYRWAPLDAWVPGGLPRLPEAEARAELVRRWLGVYGPGTEADLRWWTGWTAALVRRALARLDVVEVDLGGARGLLLAGDEEPVAAAGPWAALLPALDSTAMGWKQREWYLGPHAGSLFDRNGNAGPSVWWEGRIVGGWAQRPSGELAYRLLEDVGAAARAAIEVEAARLSAWLGGRKVTPRFRTPLEKELSA